MYEDTLYEMRLRTAYFCFDDSFYTSDEKKPDNSFLNA